MRMVIKFVTWLLFLMLAWTQSLPASEFQKLKGLLGPRDAVLVTGPDGQIRFAHNIEKQLVPASTLKIITALAALDILGENHRFKTEFYLDADSNLVIKGYGDPLLISEVMTDISSIILESFKKPSPPIADIVVDASYFDQSITIPGVTDTSEPYDAPNGALCVNFNTVNFKTVNGQYISAEPQTPLLPMTHHRITKSGLSEGRITLSHQKNELLRYAGKLFKYFFQNAGIEVRGSVRIGRADPVDRLLLQFQSPFTLKEVIEKMMTYSNNFMANQILLETGIAKFGPPGSLPKGVKAIKDYAISMEINDVLSIVEGSGISRQNRISAKGLHKMVLKFKPYHHLLRRENHDYYKTGTLKDISTRVGFMGPDGSRLYTYVILCNTPAVSAAHIRNHLYRILNP